MIPDLKWMKQNFDTFNVKYFNGQIPMPKFSFNCPSDMWGCYKADAKYIGRRITTIGSAGELCLTKRYSRNQKSIQNTLLHEMIHMYIFLVLRIKPRNNHGIDFNRIARRINRDGWNISESNDIEDDDIRLYEYLKQTQKMNSHKNIIISEEQERQLIKILKEENSGKKIYFVDPNKVLALKKKLDAQFIPLDYEPEKPIGGKAVCMRIAGRLSPKTKQVIEQLYEEDLADCAADICKNMFLDNDECEKFAKLVVNRWLNNKIGVHGMLDVNYYN